MKLNKFDVNMLNISKLSISKLNFSKLNFNEKSSTPLIERLIVKVKDRITETGLGLGRYHGTIRDTLAFANIPISQKLMNRPPYDQ